MSVTRNLKKGTKIRAIKDCPYQYTTGKIYEVSQDFKIKEDTHISTVLDDNGSRRNGWTPEAFDEISVTLADIYKAT